MAQMNPHIITNVDQTGNEGRVFNTESESFVIAVGINKYLEDGKTDERYFKWSDE